ncbi:MAG: hypothetical protein ACLFV7_10325, partial [Phycisphaerae bacterium]
PAHTYMATAVAVLAAGASIAMLRGRPWAQQTVLGFWLVVGCAALLTTLVAIFGAQPPWWDQRVPMWLVGGALLAISTACSLLVHQASSPISRLRYASTVMLTVALAVAVLLVVNVIAHADYFRRSVETLGRYGLSERSKRILENVDTPLRITAVYTSDDPKRNANLFRSRVVELLEEMAEFRPEKITVESVVSEGGKRRLYTRLTREREQRYASHMQFLRTFAANADELNRALNAEVAPLLRLTNDSYLSQWRFAPRVTQMVTDTSQKLQESGEQIRRKLAAGTIEYGKLLEDANDALTETRQLVTTVQSNMKAYAQVPSAVREAAPEAKKEIDATIDAAAAYAKPLGEPNAAMPNDLKGALTDAANAVRKAAVASYGASKVLQELGGKKVSAIVYESDAWEIDGLGIGVYFQQWGRRFDQMQMEVRQSASVLNDENLKDMIRHFRRNAGVLATELKRGRQAFDSAVATLTDVDPASNALLNQAAEDRLFARSSELLNQLSAAMEELKTPDDDTFAEDLSKENIVIIEAGDRKSVVSFDEVWPLKAQAASSETNPGEPDPRRFNGNSAIASRMLDLTREPFATVLLTYFSPPLPPDAPPYMQNMMPEPYIPPQRLTALRQRLESANFEVQEWNLTDPMPGSDANDPNGAATRPAEDSRPRVLLILPPPASAVPAGMNSPIPSFGMEEQAKIADAIDAGTGAIFLTHYHWPRQAGPFGPPTTPDYPLGDYLRQSWGIDTMTDRMVFSASRDPENPRKFKVNFERFQHMPLNTYTDHPIGKPLQGQRTLWMWVCPVTRGKNVPQEVTISPILRVPESWDATWATSEFLEIARQFSTAEGSYIQPNFEGGDMRPPFPVAVAATRSGNGNAGSRVVVLGIGQGLMDGYLDGPVPRQDAGGSVTLTDPPSTNADVVINSALWLTGWEQYIAAGPTRVRPIEPIEPVSLMAIRGIFVLGIPGVVLVIGGIVMLIRRRS